MEEQKTQEQPTTDTGNGVQLPTDNVVDRADAIAKRIEEGNKKFEELVLRNEQATARMMLSGRANAGAVQKTEKEIISEKAQAMADEVVKRFGFR